jgi:hypothetical protein
MKLPDFRRALEAAFHQHFPGIRLVMTESRGVALTCRAEIADDLLLAVYFNTLTGNTSYALVRGGERIAGYDNHRFWHSHPIGAAHQHIPCPALTPEEAIAGLATISVGSDRSPR